MFHFYKTFKQSACIFAAILLFALLPSRVLAKKVRKDYYQLSVYHFVTAEQEKRIDEYLSTAVLPALHRFGIKNIGAFKPIANDTATDKLVYIFIPLKGLEQLVAISKIYTEDKQFINDAQFLDTAWNSPSFTRRENIVLEAFDLAPAMKLPQLTGPRENRVYELRSYESPTDKLHLNKVQMFNKGGEIALFARLNFNAVFYSRVIAGSRMPNLMYMTSFENMADRDAHWKSFSADPEWKKLSGLPEYQHNVSKNDTRFLRATTYSDF